MHTQAIRKAAAIAALTTAAAAGAATTAAVLHTTSRPSPPALRLERAIVTGQTIEIDGTTYSAHPVPRPCASPALPSGDQALVHGAIWTCTDSVWHDNNGHVRTHIGTGQ